MFDNNATLISVKFHLLQKYNHANINDSKSHGASVFSGIQTSGWRWMEWRSWSSRYSDTCL